MQSFSDDDLDKFYTLEELKMKIERLLALNSTDPTSVGHWKCWIEIRRCCKKRSWNIERLSCAYIVLRG